jgi:hypothetical protein
MIYAAALAVARERVGVAIFPRTTSQIYLCEGLLLSFR